MLRMRKLRHRDVKWPGRGDRDGRTAEQQPQERSRALGRWSSQAGAVTEPRLWEGGHHDGIWAAGNLAGERVLLGNDPHPVAP